MKLVTFKKSEVQITCILKKHICTWLSLPEMYIFMCQTPTQDMFQVCSFRVYPKCTWPSLPEMYLTSIAWNVHNLYCLKSPFKKRKSLNMLLKANLYPFLIYTQPLAIISDWSISCFVHIFNKLIKVIAIYLGICSQLNFSVLVIFRCSSQIMSGWMSVSEQAKRLKLPSLFAAWLFWAFHAKSHNMKAFVILSHSWLPFLTLTSLYEKKRTFVGLYVAFRSIFWRKNSPQITHANHMIMPTCRQI